MKQVRALDYYATFTGATDILPVGIAELGLRSCSRPHRPSCRRPCQSGLLRVDGRPVDVQITGSTTAALSGQPLRSTGAVTRPMGSTWAPGRTWWKPARGCRAGWSIDSLDLGSSGGRGAAAQRSRDRPDGVGGGDAPQLGPGGPGRAPGPYELERHRDGDGGPFWLVLGQSFSSGWTASLPGGRSLGAPQLVDGYANGWYVPAGVVTGPTIIHLTWTPQGVVSAAIGVSATALVAAVVVAVWPASLAGRLGIRRRRRARSRSAPGPGSGPLPVSWAAVAGLAGRRVRPLPLAAAAAGWAVAVREW